MIFDYLLSISVLLDLVFVGLLITYFFKLDLFLEARCAAGALIGIITLGIMVFLISYLVGLNVVSLAASIIIINFVTIGYARKDIVLRIVPEWQDLKGRFRKLSWKLFFLFLSSFIVIFGYTASRLLTYANGSYFVSPVHAYGDISIHLGIISSFAFGNNFPPQNPILAGTKISYPFLADFITAIFVGPLSLRFDQAVAWVGVSLMTILIILLAYFSLKVIGSKLAACLVAILFFFNGGLGFLYFLYDLQMSNLNFFQFIQVLPRDYTALKNLGFFWINVVLSMLLPQRSFLLGFPVAILILYIFWDLAEQFDIRKLILGALLVSFLPIIHAHSLIALTPFLIWLIIRMVLKNKLLEDRKKWPVFVLGAFSIIIIFLLSKAFLQQSASPLSLIHFKLGWMAPKGEISAFYLQNFGFNLIVIPLALLFGLKKKLKIAYFALIGQLWFILPSLFLFQPWDFDNTKLFIYWYFASVVIVAFFLSKLILSRKLSGIILAGVAIYMLTFAGFLDIIRLVSEHGTRYEVYSPQAIQLAEFVKNNTEKNAVFLAIDKFDNPVVALAGRKVLVGFHGWLWTYGLDYSQKEQDVKDMLAGNAPREIFQKYGITYAIFFTDQTNYFINKDYFQANYKLIYNHDGYEIYQI